MQGERSFSKEVPPAKRKFLKDRWGETFLGKIPPHKKAFTKKGYPFQKGNITLLWFLSILLLHGTLVKS